MSLSLASAYVRAAIKARKVQFKTDEASLKWMRLYYSRMYRNFVTALATLHMALVFIEPASTMRRAPPEEVMFDTRPLEAAILLVYAADIAVKMRFMGVAQYFGAWNKMEFLCTMCFAVDLLIPSELRPGFGVQFSRILRPFFIVTRRKHLRFIFNGILNAIPRMIPILIMLVMTILAFSSCASLLLSAGTPAFSDLASNQTSFPPYCSVFSRGACEDYFGSYGGGAYHMFVLMARANWPLAALPVYSRSEWTAVFFMGFMLVSHFFFWRLLLAVSFTSFAEHCREQYIAQQRRSRAAFRAAFSLLQVGGYLEHSAFRQLAALAKPSQPPEVVDIIFHAVGGHVGFIDAQSFIAACTLLETSSYRLRYLDDERDRRALCGHTLRNAMLEFAVKDRYTLALDAIIVLTTIIEGAFFANGSWHPNVWLATTACVAAVLTAELVIKLFAVGWRRYGSKTYNKLDAFAAVSLDAAVLACALKSSPAAVMIPLFTTLRLARLVRLLDAVRPISLATRTVSAISPLLWRIMFVLFITLYCLAIVGTEAYSGVLSPSNPNVATSSYGVNKQYALNFDTFTRAFMAQFSILITTQSPLIMEGLMAGAQSWAPAWFFAFCYVVIVCLVSNILIALLLQSFGITGSRMRLRADGYVEIWEHLLIRAQFDLHAMDPWRFKHSIGWRFQRRNAFLSVNETLFGEALSLEFEMDATEAANTDDALAMMDHRPAKSAGSTDTDSTRNALRAAAAATEAFFGNLLTGLALSAPDEASRTRGFTSLRVHSTFDPIAFAAIASNQRSLSSSQLEHMPHDLRHEGNGVQRARAGSASEAVGARFHKRARTAASISSANDDAESDQGPPAGINYLQVQHAAQHANSRTQRRALTEFVRSALVPRDDAWTKLEVFQIWTPAQSKAANAARDVAEFHAQRNDEDAAAQAVAVESPEPSSKQQTTSAALPHVTGTPATADAFTPPSRRATRSTFEVDQPAADTPVGVFPPTVPGTLTREMRLRRLSTLAHALAAEHAALRNQDAQLDVVHETPARSVNAMPPRTGRRRVSAAAGHLSAIAQDDLEDEDVADAVEFDGTGLHSRRASATAFAAPAPEETRMHGLLRTLTSGVAAMRSAASRTLRRSTAVAGPGTTLQLHHARTSSVDHHGPSSFSAQDPLLAAEGSPGAALAAGAAAPARMRRTQTVLGMDVILPSPVLPTTNPMDLRRAREATIIVQDGFTFVDEST